MTKVTIEMDRDRILEISDMFNLMISKMSTPSAEKDEYWGPLDCLTHLFEYEPYIPEPLPGDDKIKDIGCYLRKAQNLVGYSYGYQHNIYEHPCIKLLSRYGLKPRHGHFLVANIHPGLEEIFHGTRWAGGLWRNDLRLLRFAKPAGVRHFYGHKPQRCTLVPVDYAIVYEEEGGPMTDYDVPFRFGKHYEA